MRYLRLGAVDLTVGAHEVAGHGALVVLVGDDEEALGDGDVCGAVRVDRLGDETVFHLKEGGGRAWKGTGGEVGHGRGAREGA